MAKIHVECKQCLKQFLKEACECRRTRNNFCSMSCAATYNNKGVQRNPKKPKSPRKILTTAEVKALTLEDCHSKLAVLGKHPSWLNSYVRGYNQTWNKKLRELPCQRCGYSVHVELAHIKAITSFPKTTTLGEVNSPDNILVLCPNHHWEFDNGHIGLSDITPRNRA